VCRAAEKLALEMRKAPQPFDDVMQMIQHIGHLSGELTEMKASVTTLQQANEESRREASSTKNANIRLEMENGMLTEEVSTAKSRLRDKENELERLSNDLVAKSSIIRRKDDVIDAIKMEKRALEKTADTKVNWINLIMGSVRKGETTCQQHAIVQIITCNWYCNLMLKIVHIV